MNHDRLKHSAIDDADLDETDRQIQQALHSASVPASAKQRLLARLHAEQVLQRVGDEEVAVQPHTDQQDAVELASATTGVGQTESRPAVVTAKTESAPRSRKQTMTIIACLAASILAMISLFIAAQPYSQDRLVAECTQRLEMQPANSWDQATLSSWTESLNLLRIAGIVRNPKQILHQSIHQTVIGSQVRFWKLEFEDQPSLYAVELLDAPSVQGVQQYMQRLNHANQSWSMATIRADKSVFVFFTKGNLDLLMQVSPLA
jgi:hypothetical protein